jgi:hypothetical protein
MTTRKPASVCRWCGPDAGHTDAQHALAVQYANEHMHGIDVAEYETLVANRLSYLVRTAKETT